MIEPHRAIEINVIYIKPGVDPKNATDRFMRSFIQTVQSDPGLLQGIDVVSYALLGKQEQLIHSILWYGFKAVGQAIVKFNIVDPVSIQILKQQQFPPLPEGYEIKTWEPQWAGEIAKVIHASFEKSADALWDPRFRTELGARQVIGMIHQGVMGAHVPSCTSVALKDGQPVGVCFMIQSSPVAGNIPVICVRPEDKSFLDKNLEQKGLGLGNRLLLHSMNAVVDNMLAGTVAMIEVNATHDTDNIPAIKMYRRIGFREEYNYPHVYLTKEKLMAFKPGVWC